MDDRRKGGIYLLQHNRYMFTFTCHVSMRSNKTNKIIYEYQTEVRYEINFTSIP